MEKIKNLLLYLAFPLSNAILFFICWLYGTSIFSSDVGVILATIFTLIVNFVFLRRMSNAKHYHFGVLLIGYLLPGLVLHLYEGRKFYYIPFLGTYLISNFYIIPSVILMVVMVGIRFYLKHIKNKV